MPLYQSPTRQDKFRFDTPLAANADTGWTPWIYPDDFAHGKTQFLADVDGTIGFQYATFLADDFDQTKVDNATYTMTTSGVYTQYREGGVLKAVIGNFSVPYVAANGRREIDFKTTRYKAYRYKYTNGPTQQFVFFMVNSLSTSPFDGEKKSVGSGVVDSDFAQAVHAVLSAKDEYGGGYQQIITRDGAILVKEKDEVVTPVFNPGTATTTTSGQVATLLTYTVPALKRFEILSYSAYVGSALSGVFAAQSTKAGTITLEKSTNGGSSWIVLDSIPIFLNASSPNVGFSLQFSHGLYFDEATQFRMRVTAAVTQSVDWAANLIGYTEDQ